ncbi:MAG: hypothetical protein DI629_03865 [Mesorhizobium amorphae]|nr:MAG: hypothetical protein DI629_03865 [Mesorhizobium amorphae]
MTDIKPWYLSRTIWASLVTVLMAIAGYLRVPLDGFDAGAATDTLLQLVTAVAGLTAIIGRLQARNRIG